MGLLTVNIGEPLRVVGTVLKKAHARRPRKEGNMKAMLLPRVFGRIADQVENVYSIRSMAFSTVRMRTALRDSTCRSIYLTILFLWASSCSISTS